MAKREVKSKKKVSVIIPFYKQTEAELALPLSSLYAQIGIDMTQVDVHLVNDGGPTIDASKFAIFETLDLHLHELVENVGAGMARQYGIDHSEGEYLMFMDADDVLNSSGVLLDFFNAAKQGRHQVISMSYLEQMPDAKKGWLYKIHANQNNAGVYAKWFNRHFLEQERIRFAPELRIFEDAYFIQTIFFVATDIFYGNSLAYVWKSNEKSLTRDNGGAQTRKVDAFVLMNRLWLEFIQKRRPKELKAHFLPAVASIYLYYKLFSAADESAFWEELRKLISEFLVYWTGYSENLQKLTDQYEKAPSSFYKGVDTSDLKEFVEKI